MAEIPRGNSHPTLHMWKLYIIQFAHSRTTSLTALPNSADSTELFEAEGKRQKALHIQLLGHVVNKLHSVFFSAGIYLYANPREEITRAQSNIANVLLAPLRKIHWPMSHPPARSIFKPTFSWHLTASAWVSRMQLTIRSRLSLQSKRSNLKTLMSPNRFSIDQTVSPSHRYKQKESVVTL